MEGPFGYYSIFVSIFYVFVVVVSSFVVINLVIAVFVEAYYTATNQVLVTEQKTVEPRVRFPTLHDDPRSPTRLLICRVVNSNEFDMLIAFFIVANVLVMAFESYKEASWQTRMATAANFLFSLVFGWECLFKLHAFGAARYYSTWWARFDSFIVFISFGDILSDGIGHGLPFNPKSLRVLRVLRAFRILKSAKGLQRLLGALRRAIPALCNILILLAIVFFIFSVLGVALFGQLCVLGEEQAPGLEAVRCMFSSTAPGGGLLDPKMNFRDVGHALIILFRIATTDGWSGYMWSVVQAPQPVRGPIPDVVWQQYLAQNGTSAEAGATIPPPKDYMQVVLNAMKGWKEAVLSNSSFVEGPGTWPYPNPVAQGWAQVAQSVLLNCVTDDEVAALEAAGLANCTVLGQERPCAGTCSANFWVGVLYFCAFTLFSAFILLQLVIAVLLEQMMNRPGHSSAATRAPGTRSLPLRVLDRIGRRWRYAALRKLRARCVPSDAPQCCPTGDVELEGYLLPSGADHSVSNHEQLPTSHLLWAERRNAPSSPVPVTPTHTPRNP